MTRNLLRAGALLFLTATGAVHAQTVGEVDKRQSGVIEAWEKTTLTTRRAIFVKNKAPLFGAYEERGSNVFKPNEPLLVYAEPVGYGWRSGADGFDFGISVDFQVKKPDGQILGGQERFTIAAFKSRAKVQELMVNLTLTLTDFPVGDYVLEYKLHDITSDKATSFALPFKITP